MLYHTYDSPEISDTAYDNYYSELKKIENEHPSIISKNSPTQRVGSDLLDSFEKENMTTQCCPYRMPLMKMNSKSSIVN